LLGLAVAALITNRLSRPVRSLANAMRDVQGGNLNIELPVSSRDEVGRLTDSFNFFAKELRSKERLKQTFGKYIDPRILEHVLAQSGSEAVGSGRREMTVLFADLVGFTGLSERLTPLLMVTLLNRHFGLQALAVQEHHGVVDKFIGDSVMAFGVSPSSSRKNTPCWRVALHKRNWPRSTLCVENCRTSLVCAGTHLSSIWASVFAPVKS